jgi:hypothetical protein
MGYIMGVCPQCNNVMSMPDDCATVRCPSCQAEVRTAEAAALAGGTPDPGVQQQQDPFAAAAGTVGQAGYPAPPQPPTGAFSGNAPLLGTWKTNALFTVLGIVAAIILNGFMGQSGNANSPFAASGGAVMGVLSLAYLVFCIFYAAKIYPSYFSDKPTLTSNEAISFLNGLVGGIIFGLLWNHNLTLREKGISNIVYIVLIATSFVLVFLLIFLFGFALVATMA